MAGEDINASNFIYRCNRKNEGVCVMHKWAEICKKNFAFLRFLLLLFDKSCIYQKNVVSLRRFSRRLYVYAVESREIRNKKI